MFKLRYLSALILFALSLPGQAADNTEKLQFIQQHFTAAAAYSRTWQYGWLGVYSTAGAVNGIQWAASGSHSERYDGKVGVISSALGVGDLLLNPMPTHTYAATLSHTQIELAEAETWLRDAAAKEQYQRSFMNHFLSAVVSVAAGLAVAVEDKRHSDGWLTFATNMLASEAKILTAPTAMSEALKAYQAEDLAYQARAQTEPRWQLVAQGPTLGISVQF